MKYVHYLSVILLFTLMMSSCKGPIGQLQSATTNFSKTKEDAIKTLMESAEKADNIQDSVTRLAAYEQAIAGYNKSISESQQVWEKAYKRACRFYFVKPEDPSKNKRIDQCKKDYQTSLSLQDKGLLDVFNTFAAGCPSLDEDNDSEEPMTEEDWEDDYSDWGME